MTAFGSFGGTRGAVDPGGAMVRGLLPTANAAQRSLPSAVRKSGTAQAYSAYSPQSSPQAGQAFSAYSSQSQPSTQQQSPPQPQRSLPSAVKNIASPAQPAPAGFSAYQPQPQPTAPSQTADPYAALREQYRAAADRQLEAQGAKSADYLRSKGRQGASREDQLANRMSSYDWNVTNYTQYKPGTENYNKGLSDLSSQIARMNADTDRLSQQQQAQRERMRSDPIQWAKDAVGQGQDWRSNVLQLTSPSQMDSEAAQDNPEYYATMQGVKQKMLDAKDPYFMRNWAITDPDGFGAKYGRDIAPLARDRAQFETMAGAGLAAPSWDSSGSNMQDTINRTKNDIYRNYGLQVGADGRYAPQYTQQNNTLDELNRRLQQYQTVSGLW
jgi:hypothetical protein